MSSEGGKLPKDSSGHVAPVEAAPVATTASSITKGVSKASGVLPRASAVATLGRKTVKGANTGNEDRAATLAKRFVSREGKDDEPDRTVSPGGKDSEENKEKKEPSGEKEDKTEGGDEKYGGVNDEKKEDAIEGARDDAKDGEEAKEGGEKGDSKNEENKKEEEGEGKGEGEGKKKEEKEEDEKKDLGVDKFLEEPPMKAKQYEAKERNWEADDVKVESGLGDEDKHAGQLTADEWEQVLENCGVMYGWCIDRAKNRITRAPKPAFRLRTIECTKTKPLNPPLIPKQVGDKKASAETQKSEKKDEARSTSSIAAPPTDDSQQVSIENLGSSITVSVKGKDAHVSIVPVTGQISSTSVKSRPPQVDEDEEDKGDKEEAEKEPEKMKPAYSVNDNSRIDVIVSAHEFETSMATNDFSAQSTEGSVGGGWGGISASASYSNANSKSSGISSSSNQYKKTMIAKFLFPRADVFLHASNMEATPELEAAIAKIREKKNIKDLRKLQSDFGYLFCRRVTVGGRLQTMKIMDEASKTSDQEQKQTFKESVGVSVSSPWVSASVSHSTESGRAASNSQTEINKSEKHVFEAMGGDTLLASNPTAWAPTVGKYTNWRVIERDSLTLMADIISEIDGYGDIKFAFAQAIPVLSKYLEFTDSPDKKIRLRLTSPNNGLSLSFLKDAQKDVWNPPKYYLGHAPTSYTMPRAMGVNISNIWDTPKPRGSDAEPEPLFSPRCYRAPAIYGYASNKVGNSVYGTVYDEDYASTVWSIMAPYDEALCHESRVILRSEPIDTENMIPEAHGDGNDGESGLLATLPCKPVSSLIIFRNQQGVFLPGMSDNEEVQIWRILKQGAAPGEKINIKEGDEIRLAWSFKDQTSGYRDFTDDIFGRRRTGSPPGMENTTLYMKLPWPRFEALESAPGQPTPLPNALIMSDKPQDASFQGVPLEEVSTIYAKKVLNTDTQVYGMQDCSFRLDLVGNLGRGDVNDYLLLGISQEGIKHDAKDAATKRNEELLRQQRVAAEMINRMMLNEILGLRVAMGLSQIVAGQIGAAGSDPKDYAIASMFSK